MEGVGGGERGGAGGLLGLGPAEDFTRLLVSCQQHGQSPPVLFCCPDRGRFPATHQELC